MTYIIFAIVTAIVAISAALVGVKYAGHRKHRNAAGQDGSTNSSKSWDGRVERRASKRTAGALYHKPDGNWVFR